MEQTTMLDPVEERTFPVMADNVMHAQKPTDWQTGAATNRLKRGRHCDLTLPSLIRVCTSGIAWMPCAHEPAPQEQEHGFGQFVAMGLVVLDFDNDGPGKRPLRFGEEGFILPRRAAERLLDALHIRPLFYHLSASASAEKMRFRLIGALPEVVTDEAEAKSIIKLVLSVFPEADQSCCHTSKIYFGAWKAKARVYDANAEVILA